jgi:phytol kinase
MTPVQQDLSVSALAIGGTLVWLQIWITLARNGKIDSKLSRKIIHSGSAPIFMCLWPLYSNTPGAKYFASGVVFLQLMRLVLAGLKKEDGKDMQSASKFKIVAQNIQSDSEAVKEGREGGIVDAISRGGSRTEALKGPLIYTVILLIGTLVWFRGSPVGVIGITQMAAGDGFADIVGRRYGKKKWAFAPDKSVAGTAGFVGAATVVTTVLVMLFSATGSISPALELSEVLPKVLLISVFCGLVELIPVWDDNVSVPLAGALAAKYLFEM